MVPEEARLRYGLCGHCRHAGLVTSAKGSEFILCAFSRIDPSYPKYPVLPMLTCAAFFEGTPLEQP